MDVEVDQKKSMGKNVADSARNSWTQLVYTFRSGVRTRMLLLPLWATALFVILLAGIIPIFINYRDNHLPSHTQPTIMLAYDHALYNETAFDNANFTFVGIKTKVSDVDVLSNTIKLSVDIAPKGRYNPGNGLALTGLDEGCFLQLRISGVVLTYENGASINHFEVPLFLDELVPPAMYPLDEYQTQMFMVLAEVCTGVNSAGNATKRSQEVPLLWYAFNTYPQYTFSTIPQPNVTFASTGNSAALGMEGTVSEASVGVTIKRSGQAIAFSVIITILAWLISGFLLVVVIDMTLVRPRESTPVLLGPSVTMLFALPTVRNAQPGIPATGIAIDLVGLYWNVCMVCVSILLLLAHHMGRYRHSAAPNR